MTHRRRKRQLHRRMQSRFLRPAPLLIAGAALFAPLCYVPVSYAQTPTARVGLPNECSPVNCQGRTFDQLNALGAQGVVATPNSLTINQAASSAIFNWSSFNIQAGNSVQFVQPSASSVALNRIHDPLVSTIDGNLRANGQIYLINPNGILFGQNARVDVGALIASTLNVRDERITRGLLSNPLVSEPTFFADQANVGGITVQHGARIYAAGRDQAGTIVSAGRVFMFAPDINNQGTIQVDGGGQVIFGAGREVFLGSSADPTLRGLTVEVKSGGKVDHVGNIEVARGNVTMMGLAINQAGRVTATSAIRENGSILLIARENPPSSAPEQTTKSGTLTFATGSETRVVLDESDRGTAPLNDEFAARARSLVVGFGGNVQLGGTAPAGTALIEARGGDVRLVAQGNGVLDSNYLNLPNMRAEDAGATVRVAADARIDVSGLRDVQVDGARNFIYIDRLTSNDLRDAPLQRDGFLRGQGVYLNVAVEHPFIDTANRRAAVAGTQAERNAVAGTIALRAEGSVDVERGAALDVSGGSTSVTAASGRTSQLIAANGRVVDIMRASATEQYVGFADTIVRSVNAPREGVNFTSTYSAPRYTAVGGYREGKDAGSVELIAPRGTFSGNLVGATIVGTQQRSAPPLGAALRIGASGRAADLDTEAQFSRPNVGIGRDDLAAWVASLSPANRERLLMLDPELLQSGAAQRLLVTSDGEVRLGAAPLDLGPRGELVVQANAIRVGGSVNAPGGTIALVERPLSASQQANAPVVRDERNLVAEQIRGQVRFDGTPVLSTAGNWTNDYINPVTSTTTAPIVRDGGSITVASRDVDVSAVRFDTSSGAALNGARAFSGGRGGSLTISGSYVAPGQTVPADTGALQLGDGLATRISGFGVSGSGTLSITAPGEIELGAAQTASASPGRAQIGADLLERGFGGFRFTANDRVAVVQGGTAAPVIDAYGFSTELLTRASTPKLADVAVPLTPLDAQRRGATIALNARSAFGGTVAVGGGATIDAGPQGQIAIDAGAKILVEGRLQAAGGAVSMNLAAPPSFDLPAVTPELLEQRQIAVAPGARIDVSGVSRVLEDSRGQRSGAVLDGGRVSINAGAGFIAVHDGAQIAAEGARDRVDVRGPTGATQRIDVGSAGGTFAAESRYGIFLDGQFSARGGLESSRPGATSIALRPGQDTGRADLEPLEGGVRSLTVQTQRGPLPALGGRFAAADYAGKARIAPGLVNDSGFADLWLASSGRFAVAESVQLNARNSLVIDAPTIAVEGAHRLALQAPYLALGGQALAESGEAATAGAGSVLAEGRHVDLVGALRFDGVAEARVTARDDLRLRGQDDPSLQAARRAGELRFAGNLDLSAAQIYPATQTDYRIVADVPGQATEGGRLRTTASATQPIEPLSAGGQLTISVAEFDHGGRIAAPHGSINVDASRSVVLQPGSVLAVAATGTVPFGSVLNGVEWRYADALIGSAAGVDLQDKGVRIDSPSLDARAGSIIDVGGGGQMQALQFTAGPLGSRDPAQNVFSTTNAAGATTTTANPLFALVPARGDQAAPYDPQIFRDLATNAGAAVPAGAARFRIGETITIGGGSAIPAGTYTILPARYAYLPGAFAVEPVPGYTDLAFGRVIAEASGTLIVAGTRGFAGSGVSADRTAGFRVYTREQLDRLGENREVSGDVFFRNAAAAAGQVAPRVAADAAALSVAAGQIRLEAELRTAPAADGRGAELVLAAPSMRVVDGPVAPASGTSSELVLSAQALSSQGLETLSLGATLARSGTSTSLTTRADTVAVESRTALKAGEVILGARNEVLLDGAVASTSAPVVTRGYEVAGNGAALVISNAQTTPGFSRTGADGGSGTLSLGPQGRIQGTSVVFDAALEQKFASAATFDVVNGNLSASNINFGQIPAGTDGLSLDSALLLQLVGIKNLALTATGELRFFGEASLGGRDANGAPLLNSLTLNAGRLTGMAGTGGEARTRIVAGDVTMAGGTTASVNTTGAGSLQIEASAGGTARGRIAISGQVGLAGYADVALNADGAAAGTGTIPGTGDVVFSGQPAQSARLATGGNLSIDATRITAQSGVDGAISAGGAFITRASRPASAAELVELGGALAVQAASVDHGGRIDLPAGVVQLTATAPGGSVQLQQGSSIRVAGVTQAFGNTSADASAGRVVLGSAQGDITISAGSTIDLRGAGQNGDAGSLALRAPNGALDLRGSVGTAREATARGAEFEVDVRSVGPLSSLVAALQGDSTLPAARLDVRARTGDLVVGADDVIRAQNLTLTADGASGPADGNVSVLGRIDARAPDGGRVALHANNQIALGATAQIDASATRPGSSGGRVLASARVRDAASAPTSLDAISIEAGARVNVSGGVGGDGGQVTLRAGRVGDDVAIAPLPSDYLTGARLEIVEGVQVFTQPGTTGLTLNPASGVLAQQGVALQAYMSEANRTLMTDRLGRTGNPTFSLRPGLELRHAGNITVAGAIDFAAGLDAGADTGTFAWRYGGTTLGTSHPGALTLRAGGNLAVNQSVSDGFDLGNSSSEFAAVFKSGESWRYAFAAGADLSAADPTRVLPGTGALTVGTASGSNQRLTVRTGTGDIQLAAGNQIQLNTRTPSGSQPTAQLRAAVYTAGVADGPQPVIADPVVRDLQPAFTRRGGDVTLEAGNDLNGVNMASATNNATGNTHVTNWLFRAGRNSNGSFTGAGDQPTLWWVNFATFDQGVGALAGGNVVARAGRDIQRLGAYVASNAFVDAAGATARVVEQRGGTLDVRAGRKVADGLFYNEAGTASVRGDSIGRSALSNLGGVRFAQGSGDVDVQARTTIEARASFNPNAFTQSALNDLYVGSEGFENRSVNTRFFTFAPTSKQSFRSAGGDIALFAPSAPSGFNAISTPGLLLNSGELNNQRYGYFNVTAPVFDLVAFGGKVAPGTSGTTYRLYPSADGQLRVLAATAIGQASSAGAPAIMRIDVLQSDAAKVGTALAPQPATLITGLPDPIQTPLVASTPLQAAASAPVYVVARDGSIQNLRLTTAKAAEVVAAGSIGPRVGLQIQNTGAESRTLISAGKSIDLSGDPSNAFIRIDGPGMAEVVAGEGISLADSQSGIVSSGSLRNTSLPPDGASLIVVAGSGTDASGFARRPDFLNAVRSYIGADAFASAGADAGVLNGAVLEALRGKASAAFVAAVEAGLRDRASVLDPQSAVSQALARLTPNELAGGTLQLAKAVQAVANTRFVQTKNTDTFAAGYVVFTDLFPAIRADVEVFNQFIVSNPFQAADPAGADALRRQVVAALPAEVAAVLELGLAAPDSVNDPGSAYRQALASLSPDELSRGGRQLLASTLAVAGQELDRLRATGRVDPGVGTPFAAGLNDLASAASSTGLPGTRDVSLVGSQIKAEAPGDVYLLVPQGGVAVGQASTSTRAPSEQGLFTFGGGDLVGLVRDNFDVFRSRVFTVAGGDIHLWSSLGNIDAGRGPRDVAVAPPPRLRVDADGNTVLDVTSTVSGSGIGALKTSDSQPPSDIQLIAPRGFIDAGEAGIRAETGTVTLGTNIVLNAGNIQAASGVSGGAVVSAPPAPLPPSSVPAEAERAVSDLQRAAAADQQEAEKRAAAERRRRVTGEFIGFGDD